MGLPVERRTLQPVGNTVRIPGAAACGGPTAVLVVDGSAASRAWLSLAANARPAAVRHFLTTTDLVELAEAGQVPVVPNVVPSFLVAVAGFFVDAFPAPLPPPGEAPDPAKLLRVVEAHLAPYT
jgi:hypothetical protein